MNGRNERMGERAGERVEVFGEAMELPERERGAFLDRACAGRPELRAEVEALLKNLEGAGAFLSSATAETAAGPVGAAGPLEGPGAMIGRYKLLQVIGEGGFGVVYMAEQSHPIVRRVAVKVIRAGMDTRQVLARFEAERQALALMEHPNIARVLDAGATESGRPYFVMELVRGTPMTEFCDANRLAAEERLKLFVQVCSAVQHAHQKGIIHRDIKPSNVLVTLHDGEPVPKVIDFGIAKATSTRLTDRTLFTEFRQFIGTPEYVSPEQAEMSGLDVDTRSDVYSLGVLLYELLTGATPIDGAELRKAGFAELQRMIRETEPLKPSTRVNTLGQARLSEIAQRRQVEPGKLSGVMRGELDWIVMRAMEKDRRRRYDSPSALAEDVRRHLAGEAVLASPPSGLYRLRKVMGRNKGLFATGAVIGLALCAGLGATALGMMRAEQARGVEARERAAADAAREQAVAERDGAIEARTAAEAEAAKSKALLGFFEEAMASVDPAGAWRLTRAGGPMAAATALVGPVGPAGPGGEGGGVAGAEFSHPNRLTLADFLRRAAERAGSSFEGQPLLEAAARRSLGLTMTGQGMEEEGIEQLRKAGALHESVLGPKDKATLGARIALAKALYASTRTTFFGDEFKRVLAGALAEGEGVLDPRSHDWLWLRLMRGWGRQEQKGAGEADWAEGMREVRAASEEADEVFGRTAPEAMALFDLWQRVAYWYGSEREAAAERGMARWRLAVAERGAEDYYTGVLAMSLSGQLRDQGRFAESVELARSAGVSLGKILGPTALETVLAQYQAAQAAVSLGREREGLALVVSVFKAMISEGRGADGLVLLQASWAVTIAMELDDGGPLEGLLEEVGGPAAQAAPDLRLEPGTMMLMEACAHPRAGRFGAMLLRRAEEHAALADRVGTGPIGKLHAQAVLGCAQMLAGPFREGLRRWIEAQAGLIKSSQVDDDKYLELRGSVMRLLKGREMLEEDYRDLEESAGLNWADGDLCLEASWIAMTGGDAERVLKWAKAGYEQGKATRPASELWWVAYRYALVLREAGQTGESEAYFREAAEGLQARGVAAWEGQAFNAWIGLAAELYRRGANEEGDRAVTEGLDRLERVRKERAKKLRPARIIEYEADAEELARLLEKVGRPEAAGRVRAADAEAAASGRTERK